MDKQKQTFEEMVKELAKDMGIAFQLANTTRFGVIAADLIEIGYRKIPKNAVVLTREEFEQVYGTVKAHGELLKNLQEAKSVFEKEMEEAQKELVKQFEENEKEVRKETAEKFAEMVSKAFIGLNCIDIDEWNWCQRKIDEICKEITEGKV